MPTISSPTPQNLPIKSTKSARSGVGRGEDAVSSPSFEQILNRSNTKPSREEPRAEESNARPPVERPAKTKSAKVEPKDDSTDPSAVAPEQQSERAAKPNPADDATIAEQAAAPAPEAEPETKDDPTDDTSVGEVVTPDAALVESTLLQVAVASTETQSKATVTELPIEGDVEEVDSAQPTGSPAVGTSKPVGAKPVASSSIVTTAASPVGTGDDRAGDLGETDPSGLEAAGDGEPNPEFADLASPIAANKPIEQPSPTTALRTPVSASGTDLSVSAIPAAQPASTPVAPSAGSLPSAPPVPAEARFAEANHPQIVTAMRGQLLPTGGSMQIRLDPPELGALMISLTVKNGVVDASLQASNADAAQLLSHSLTQLKHSLESQGISVDRLQVSQAPRSERGSDTQNDRNNPNQQQSQSQFDWDRQSDHQRREALKRMWAKLGVGDPLDMVA